MALLLNIPIEGCSSISNFNGNLLFYTDGITVWNRNHVPMPNGTGLKGHPSSTQSGIIVPHPGNPNLYYIFTVAEGGGPDGLQYNIVNMTLDGGMGDITIKNVLLDTPVTERLTAVAHSNGTDIWVLAHRHNSNEFIAYLITPTGLTTTPITTAVGFTYVADGSQNDTRGYMKVSPDGTLLAIATSRNLEILQFDSTTGLLGNTINLYPFIQNFDTLYSPFCYGVEFSSDSSKLYASSTYFRNFTDRYYALHQFNVSTYDETSILNSGVLVSQRQSIQIAGLQLAIDGKIYVAQNEQGYLGVINNPNIQGVGCAYIENGISLGGRLSMSGLPPFIQSYFIVGLTAKNFCLGNSTEFKISTSEPITNINWNFGDGNTSSLENPSHVYGAPGDYTVTVTATTTSETKTELKQITIYNSPVANPITDFEVCSPSTNYEFDLSTKDSEILGMQLSTETAIAYYPTLTDAQNNINALPTLYTNNDTTEKIFTRISNLTNPNCYDITSFDIIVGESPELFIVDDWVACDTNSDGSFDFNLSLKDVDVLNGQSATDFSVSYHLSLADADMGANAIGPIFTNTTATEQIFFRIENNAHPECFEMGNFNLEVISMVRAENPSDIEICDEDNDGLTTIVLSEKDAEILGSQGPVDFTVSYHASQTDADSGLNPLKKSGHTNTSRYTETIYARVSNIANASCYDTSVFSLRVFDSPVSPTVGKWEVCDDDNDGTYSFELSRMDAEISEDIIEGHFTISYHVTEADALTGLNSLPEKYRNISNPQTIFYRIENNLNNVCSHIDSFELWVFDTPVANKPADVILCDSDETGFRTFSLSEKDAEILNGQDSNDFVVSYFKNLLDAEAGRNPIPKSSYTNTVAEEEIYARITNAGNENCYSITSFRLSVNPLPRPYLEETYVICPDNPELTIDGGDFETWSWTKNDGLELNANRTFNVTDIGEYTLTISQTISGITCEKTVSFEIVSSGAPEDFTTDLGNPSDKVSITVTASGSGQFEYSTDGSNFQDSNRFEVFPGMHTLYVRDKFLCRTISKEVIALGYQKFFTPNDDGANDHWNIIGASQYPRSQLYIFDRYGKLIGQFSPVGLGWDGTYNGSRMPSSDYWFRFLFDEGKVFTGHFSLKR